MSSQLALFVGRNDNSGEEPSGVNVSTLLWRLRVLPQDVTFREVCEAGTLTLDGQTIREDQDVSVGDHVLVCGNVRRRIAIKPKEDGDNVFS